MSFSNERDYTFKVSAAGRVNLIGEHIDYCGGKVFPAALSLKNNVYIRANGTDTINISWSTSDVRVSLDVAKLDSYRGIGLGKYQAGSLYFWQQAGHKVIGCDMYQDCQVPFGSGLSSSAAIEVSTIAAMATLCGESFDKVEVALTAQKAEREYCGVNCGIMDQYASACGKKGHAMLLNCATLECTYIPLNLKEYSLVVIDSKKPHNLVESKYNERRAETDEALKILQKYVPINSLAELGLKDFSKYSAQLSPVIERRARHVVEECERVEMAENRLIAEDLVAFGSLLKASHCSLKDLYEVTGTELDTLVNAASEHPACIGARMTGAGFGGSIIALVKTESVNEFIDKVKTTYHEATGYDAEAFVADVDDGITVEKIS